MLIPFSKSKYKICKFAFFLEYDDGDGNQSHEQYDDYNNYGSASQQSTSPNKRKYENGPSTSDPDDEHNDDAEEPKDGESSTSSEGLPKKKRRKEFSNPNAKFMDGVQGVQLVTDQVNKEKKNCKQNWIFIENHVQNLLL